AERCDEARHEISVCAVQLDHVEACVDAMARRAYEVLPYCIHVGSRHLARRVHRWCVRNRGWSDGLPSAGIQRGVARFPRELRRTSTTRLTQLQTDLGVALAVHEVHDASPRLCVLARVHAGADEGYARVWRHAYHLGEDQPCAAECPCAEVHRVELARHAV